jgi:crotonobetainyl-CoA:carnitine CoA-transferase CaiB-like acyl-CoA transferase
VTAPHLPSIEALVIDTGRGKRAAHLDLRQPADAERLRALLRQADVFVQSYRPGALAGRGWSVEEVARLRPGIVYVTLSAYGHAGPWRERRGFDSLVQSVSGIVDAETRAAGAARPRHLPAAALDHASGQLMALGALTALARRAREGGSWLVRVALARTGRWIEDLGPVDGIGVPDPTPDDVADLLEDSDSAFGRLRVVRPVVRMSETPPRLDRPAAPLGTHSPVWPA